MANDSDYGMFARLRGYTNFEDVYQGLSHAIPIVLSTQPSGKDPAAQASYERLIAELRANQNIFPTGGLTAADNGIDPFLVSGFPTTLGAYVSLQLPALPLGTDATFCYTLIWRVRSVEDYNEQGVNYHQAIPGLGLPDDGSTDVDPAGVKYGGGAAVRKLLVAGYETVRYSQPQPVGQATPAAQYMFPLQLQGHGDTAPVLQPKFPGFRPGEFAFGQYEQGIALNASLATNVLMLNHRTIASGDELIVVVQPSIKTGTYDFDVDDYNLSLLFGRCGFATGFPMIAPFGKPIKNLGVYVTTGVGPALPFPGTEHVYLMSNNYDPFYGRRHSGEREAKVDYFDKDGSFESERQSLGGTEAAVMTTQARESIQPDGLHEDYNCNCSSAIALVITWSEVGAIAHGINPSTDGLGITETRWYFDKDENGFYPEVGCSKCAYEKRKLLLTKADMEKRFTAAKQLGFLQLDPAMPRLAAFVQALQARAQPRGPGGGLMMPPGR